MKSFPSVLSALLLLCMLCACTTPTEPSDVPQTADTVAPERIIVAEYGSREQVGYSAVNIDAPETVAEMSSQIVICKILALEDMKVNLLGDPSIHYQMYILDILMDVSERLSVGDTVTVTSGDGIIPASFAYEKARKRYKKLRGLDRDSYAENEYILSSQLDAIPMEVGKTYLMFLTDEYLENEAVYAESGRSYLYELTDGAVFYTRDRIQDDRTEDELLEDIRELIDNRTGIADEIGVNAYMRELEEQQQKQFADEYAAQQTDDTPLQ